MAAKRRFGTILPIAGALLKAGSAYDPPSIARPCATPAPTLSFRYRVEWDNVVLLHEEAHACCLRARPHPPLRFRVSALRVAGGRVSATVGTLGVEETA